MSRKIIITFKSLLLLLLVVIAGELAARLLLGLGTPPLSMADPEIEYLFKPNQDVKRFGNRQLYNAYSMRNENFPLAKPAKELRIIIFGDSVLNGGNFTAHKMLATTLLQQHLSRSLNKSVLIGNVSAGSWGPPNMLAYAKKFGLFNADRVMVQLSSHDIADVPTFAPLDPNTHPTKNPPCALYEGVVRYLPRYMPWLKTLLQTTNQEKLPAALSREETEAKIAMSLNALSELYEISKASGASFSLILHAERGEAETGAMRLGHNRFLAWAKKYDIAVLNMLPIEAKALKSGNNIYRQDDGIHLSLDGQKLWADTLFKNIASSLR